MSAEAEPADHHPLDGPPPPTADELHARLSAFEQRTADLEAVLIGLVLAHRNGQLSATTRDAWRRLADSS